MSLATDIFVTAGKVKRSFQKWVSDPHDIPLPDSYWENIDRLLALCEKGGLDEAFTTSTLKHLIYKTREYLDAYRLMVTRMDRKPMPEFFDAQSRLCDEILDWPNLHSKRKVLPKIQDLVKQDVPLHQIAMIYGFIHPHSRNGLDYKIQEELDNPGSVIGPDYVHPDELIRREKRAVIEQWLNDDYSECVDGQDKENNAPIEIESIITIGQAYEAGLSVGKAADHLGLPVSQVANFYEKEDEARKQEDASQDDDTYDPEWSKGLTFAELREMATSLGVSTRSNMKRETVIERIEAVQEETNA